MDIKEQCESCLELKQKIEDDRKLFENKVRLCQLFKEVICTKDSKIKQEVIPIDLNEKSIKEIQENDAPRKKIEKLTSTITLLLKEKQESLQKEKFNNLLNHDLEKRIDHLLFTNKQLISCLKETEEKLQESKCSKLRSKKKLDKKKVKKDIKEDIDSKDDINIDVSVQEDDETRGDENKRKDEELPGKPFEIDSSVNKSPSKCDFDILFRLDNEEVCMSDSNDGESFDTLKCRSEEKMDSLLAPKPSSLVKPIIKESNCDISNISQSSPYSSAHDKNLQQRNMDSDGKSESIRPNRSPVQLLNENSSTNIPSDEKSESIRPNRSPVQLLNENNSMNIPEKELETMTSKSQEVSNSDPEEATLPRHSTPQASSQEKNLFQNPVKRVLPFASMSKRKRAYRLETGKSSTLLKPSKLFFQNVKPKVGLFSQCIGEYKNSIPKLSFKSFGKSCKLNGSYSYEQGNMSCRGIGNSSLSQLKSSTAIENDIGNLIDALKSLKLTKNTSSNDTHKNFKPKLKFGTMSPVFFNSFTSKPSTINSKSILLECSSKYINDTNSLLKTMQTTPSFNCYRDKKILQPFTRNMNNVKRTVTFSYTIQRSDTIKQELNITLEDPYCTLKKFRDVASRVSSLEELLNNLTSVCDKISSHPCAKTGINGENLFLNSLNTRPTLFESDTRCLENLSEKQNTGKPNEIMVLEEAPASISLYSSLGFSPIDKAGSHQQETDISKESRINERSKLLDHSIIGYENIEETSNEASNLAETVVENLISAKTLDSMNFSSVGFKQLPECEITNKNNSGVQEDSEKGEIPQGDPMTTKNNEIINKHTNGFQQKEKKTPTKESRIHKRRSPLGFIRNEYENHLIRGSQIHTDNLDENSTNKFVETVVIENLINDDTVNSINSSSPELRKLQVHEISSKNNNDFQEDSAKGEISLQNPMTISAKYTSAELQQKEKKTPKEENRIHNGKKLLDYNRIGYKNIQTGGSQNHINSLEEKSTKEVVETVNEKITRVDTLDSTNSPSLELKKLPINKNTNFVQEECKRNEISHGDLVGMKRNEELTKKTVTTSYKLQKQSSVLQQKENKTPKEDSRIHKRRKLLDYNRIAYETLPTGGLQNHTNSIEEKSTKEVETVNENCTSIKSKDETIDSLCSPTLVLKKLYVRETSSKCNNHVQEIPGEVDSSQKNSDKTDINTKVGKKNKNEKEEPQEESKVHKKRKLCNKVANLSTGGAHSNTNNVEEKSVPGDVEPVKDFMSWSCLELNKLPICEISNKNNCVQEDSVLNEISQGDQVVRKSNKKTIGLDIKKESFSEFELVLKDIRENYSLIDLLSPINKSNFEDTTEQLNNIPDSKENLEYSRGHNQELRKNEEKNLNDQHSTPSPKKACQKRFGNNDVKINQSMKKFVRENSVVDSSPNNQNIKQTKGFISAHIIPSVFALTSRSNNPSPGQSSSHNDSQDNTHGEGNGDLASEYSDNSDDFETNNEMIKTSQEDDQNTIIKQSNEPKDIDETHFLPALPTGFYSSMEVEGNNRDEEPKSSLSESAASVSLKRKLELVEQYEPNKKPYLVSPVETINCKGNALHCALKYWCEKALNKKIPPKEKQISHSKEVLTKIKNTLSNYINAKNSFIILENITTELQSKANSQLTQMISELILSDTDIKEEPNSKKPFELTSLQKKLLMLIISISQYKNDFLDIFLSRIEEEVSSFHADKTTYVEKMVAQVHVYILICKKHGFLSRARAFLYDVLYTRGIKAYAIVSKIILVWPKMLPNYQTAEECLLTHTIVLLLIKIPTFWQVPDYIIKKYGIGTLKMNLKNKLGYRANVLYEYDELFVKIIDNIQIKGNDLALLLICKCQGFKWASAMIEKKIFPLIQEGLRESKHEELSAGLLINTGKICRGFPHLESTYFVIKVIELFEKVLRESSSMLVCDAAVEALSLLKKHNLTLVARVVSSWQPKNKSLSINCLEHIRKILNVKNVKYWNYFIDSYSSKE